MAVAFTGRVVGAQKLSTLLDTADKKFGDSVERALGFAASAVKAKAQENLKGPILTPKSGTLWSRIRTKPFLKRGARSVIHIGTTVIYGASHEWGATIVNGFGKGITITVTAKHWLERSLKQVKDRVFAIFEREIVAVKIQ